MKKYYKILATAWMAIRPLFPCFAANIEKIQWGSISNYFNFNTITEEEKRTNLETNIRLLIEEQLKLPSGQNLWKAFQFWEKQHKGLAFRFKFSLMDSTGAHVELKKYEDESQTFIFEIAINKVFAEDFKIPFWQVIKDNLQQKTNLDFKKLLNENKLYRPCLIKLVDSDDSNNWEYHLREQELPFFITLAHEFLHVLNQLERIDQYWDLDLADEYDQNGDILTILKSKISMQDFLANKLNLKNGIGILDDKYLNFWGNEENDDFLDEMTVILGSEREIEDNIFNSIGETTFLREYYNDNTIISWSHFSAKDIKFWIKMIIILEKNYVNEVLKSFSLKCGNILYIKSTFFKENCAFSIHKIKRSEKKKILTKIQTYLNSKMPTENAKTFIAIVNIQRVGSRIFIRKYVFKDAKIIKLLPKYFKISNS